MPDFEGRKYQNKLSFFLVHEDEHIKKMYKMVKNYLNGELDTLDTQKKKLFDTLSLGKTNKGFANEVPE